MPETNKKIQVICDMSRNGKTNKEIAEHFVCSTGYICRILKQNGIHQRFELPPDEEVIAFYKKTESSYKTADEFGINQKSVLKILHRNNVPTRNINTRFDEKEEITESKPHELELEVIESYKKTLSSYNVAEEFGINIKTVLRILHRNNIITSGIENYRLKAERYPREMQEEMKKLYESGTSVPELKKVYGGSIDSICNAIRRVGGTIRQPQGRKPIIIPPEKEKLICEMYNSGKSQSTIGNILGHDQKTISRILINNGIRTFKREKHSQYKNGRTMHHQGYIYVWIEPDDAMSCMRTRQGYVLEHRLNMARKLGRPLLNSETVHHLDGNRENNHVDNLQLRVGPHGRGSVMACSECQSQNIDALEFLQCKDCGSYKIKYGEI